MDPEILRPTLPKISRVQLWDTNTNNDRKLSANQFCMECKERENKRPNSLKPKSLTCTGLRVARVNRVACTIPAAICRRRLAASSDSSPAGTNCRARAKFGPSTIQYTIWSNAVCNASVWSQNYQRVSATWDAKNEKCISSLTQTKVYLHKLACCTRCSSHPHNPCRHLQAQVRCKFCSESHHCKLQSTHQN